MMMTTRPSSLFSGLFLGIWVLPATLLLGACSTTFEGNKVDYKSQGKTGPGLEVPPDLSQIVKDNRAAVPRGGSVNASSLQGNNQPAATSAAAADRIALGSIGDVRVQREGTQRWLVVGRAPDKLWNEVKAFWIDSGFTLVVDQPNLGIMETEWNENRAKLPQDGVRKLLGKVLDGLYSTNERDKFRTRLERTAEGGTEIFISHKGMMEDFTTSAREQLKWKARPIDPELEVEFLKRLMVRLGGEPITAQMALTAPTAAAAILDVRAKVVQEQGQFSLMVTDGIEQAWRRVGLSLDRTSFTVEDRDRSKGVYFVRYVEPDADKNAPGFFARMLGAKPKESLQKYQIILTAQGKQTKVGVANAQGVAIQTSDAQRILHVLADDLK
jgi:outer membrane protein assembly factor BamC